MRNVLIALTLTVLGTLPTRAADSANLAMRMYCSGRAWAVGDLLTVIVEEQTSASKQQTISTSKSATAGAAKGTMGAADSTSTVDELLQRIARQLPSYQLGGDAAFEGDGATSSTETLTADLAVRIVDILPNEVLVIRGDKLVVRGKETVNMVITGLVRRRDVSTANTVLSSRIADARIRYDSVGTVTTGSSPGWLWRAFQKVNPF